jgi:hypothetical protein
MANQFQTISSGLGQLKIYYEGPIQDQLNNELPVLRASEKITKGWSGLQVNRPLRLVRNQGIGATADNGNLPNIGRQTTAQAVIQARYNYLRFGITGAMIKASQSDVGSFVRSAAYELEMGYKDLKWDMNRQMSWNGSGALATVSSAAVASTSVTIAGRESTEQALKFLDVGATFDVYTTGGTLVQAGLTIQSISSGDANSATAVIVLDQPLTASAGNILVRAGAFGNEVQGLLTALDGATTTVYGIDRATFINYQGNVQNNAGQALSLDAMQAAYNNALRRGGRALNAVWTDFTSLRMYQKLLTPDKRYSNTVKADGTFGDKDKFYMDFMGIPVVADQSAPTRFMFLPAEAFKFYELCPLSFADEQGTINLEHSETLH